MSNIVLTAKEMLAGKKGEGRSSPAFIQPLQFIPMAEKDDNWAKDNMDFLELQGLRHIWKKAPHMAKNYNLAAGIIDKTDYIPSTASPENKDLLESLLSAQEETHLDLRFYPIIPNFVNILCAEFDKRITKITFMTADEYSYNEMLAMKQDQITQTLLQEAEQKLFNQMVESGLDPKDPANADLFKQKLSPENLKTLPEIQEYFSKNYRSMIQEWAAHQHKDDYYRFSMHELEGKAFRNSLVTDSAWFHFQMFENDYKVSVWNSMFTAVFKSPETRYGSDGHAAVNVNMLSIADILDNYGQYMTDEQSETLQLIYPNTNAGYDITGYPNDSHYDNTKSVDWNTKGDSLAMRQVTSTLEGGPAYYGPDLDILGRLMNPGMGSVKEGNYYLRVTTAYWKSQRKIGFVTQIHDDGSSTFDIVDENFEVTEKPVYNNQLIPDKTVDTLIYGQHVEWIYINQTWGGVKIGPNIPTYWGMPIAAGTNGFEPIYIGINQNKIGPLKYQFKGDNDLWGCKLPIEGTVFSDYNTRSVCPVDLLKPFQIGYNVVNNQIADILMDELGTIIAFDPNTLPQKSLGEDWGKGNYAKAYVAMRNFQILPMDRSLANVEGGSLQANAPLQQLDLSQTNRLKSRIDLAVYFKNEGLGLFGVTPQRLGQPLGRQTATGVEEALNASYVQTEKYFTQFSDYLMPRVYQMMIDLAQFYQSTKPSVRLQYMTAKEERVNFEINGTELLLRDINVYAVSNAQTRNVIEELRKLLITNNTAGGTIYELGALLTADSLGEMNNILRGIEKRSEEQKMQENNQQSELEKQKHDAEMEEMKISQDFEARENEKNRRAQVLIAEIRAAGYSGAVDLDQNAQNDFIDNLQKIRDQTEYNDTMNFKRQVESNKTDVNRDKMNLEREKLRNQNDIARMNVEIARVNTTKSEIEAKRQADEKEKERKRKERSRKK